MKDMVISLLLASLVIYLAILFEPDVLPTDTSTATRNQCVNSISGWTWKHH